MYLVRNVPKEVSHIDLADFSHELEITKSAKLNNERGASWAAEGGGVHYLVGNVAEEVGHRLAIMRSPVPSTNN